MNVLSAAVVAACAASLIGAVVSGFVTDGGIKKILGLVLGAFTVCVMIVPVSRAASDFSCPLRYLRTADQSPAAGRPWACIGNEF